VFLLGRVGEAVQHHSLSIRGKSALSINCLERMSQSLWDRGVESLSYCTPSFDELGDDHCSPAFSCCESKVEVNDTRSYWPKSHTSNRITPLV
jgi:hypothetical protein